VRKVSLKELKAHLSAIVAQAAAGEDIVITRHKRAVAHMTAVTPSVRIGARFGKARIEPLLRGSTRGRYLDVLADDRRGQGERP
jgi:antitoxin (DNA-binding transcriptional repressor) of toxin-antitoxin stability system